MPTKRRNSSSSQVITTHPLVVANWKMQLTTEQAVAATSAIKAKLRPLGQSIKIVLCPSFTSLSDVGQTLSGSPALHLGAQDVFWDERGPYTGEISPLHLQELGVEYVIVGHSERRQLFHEDDTTVARKMISAVTHGMMPILCIGESGEERRAGHQDLVVARQLQAAFRSLPPPPKDRRISIAYEPIWAIGTGEAASAEQAMSMRDVIQQTLVDIYSPELAENNFRILYGGSVTADNISDYVNPNGFHGALVGTASLDPKNFIDLLQRVKRTFN